MLVMTFTWDEMVTLGGFNPDGTIEKLNAEDERVALIRLTKLIVKREDGADILHDAIGDLVNQFATELIAKAQDES